MAIASMGFAVGGVRSLEVVAVLLGDAAVLQVFRVHVILAKHGLLFLMISRAVRIALSTASSGDDPSLLSFREGS